MAHSWQQEEVTPAQRLCCQHPVGWGSHRIVLALQDQRRNTALDRLLLDRRNRLHPPELTDENIDGSSRAMQVGLEMEVPARMS